MIVYGITLSPFVARVRMAMQFKGLAYDLQDPPGGSTRSPEYLAISPIGKIPVLVTDDGAAIAESGTIIDYLDERCPEPPLEPADLVERARMRNVNRTLDLYATPAMVRLFSQMDPATRDARIVAMEIERWRDGLALADKFVDDATFAVGGAPSKADCMLLPSLLLCEIAADIFAVANPVDDLPRLSGYRDKARQHGDMGAIWAETAAALAAKRAGD